MTTSREQQGRAVVELLAKEFLEYRLGVDASQKNIQRLAAHIVQFQNEVKQPT